MPVAKAVECANGHRAYGAYGVQAVMRSRRVVRPLEVQWLRCLPGY